MANEHIVKIYKIATLPMLTFNKYLYLLCIKKNIENKNHLHFFNLCRILIRTIARPDWID